MVNYRDKQSSDEMKAQGDNCVLSAAYVGIQNHMIYIRQSRETLVQTSAYIEFAGIFLVCEGPSQTQSEYSMHHF